MTGGLTDRERRLLEEGRQQWADHLARERRSARHREELTQRTARTGPLEVAGPDGVVVRLSAYPSGRGPALNLGSGGDPLWEIVLLVVLIPVMFLIALVRRRSTDRRPQWTVEIKATRHRRIRISVATESAAANRLKRIEERIRRDGTAALDDLRAAARYSRRR